MSARRGDVVGVLRDVTLISVAVPVIAVLFLVGLAPAWVPVVTVAILAQVTDQPLFLLLLVPCVGWWVYYFVWFLDQGPLK